MEIQYGLYVICEFEDEAPEPEGTVIFDTLRPPIGSIVILSDKKEWVITQDNMDDPINPHIRVRQKCESKSTT